MRKDQAGVKVRNGQGKTAMLAAATLLLWFGATRVEASAGAAFPSTQTSAPAQPAEAAKRPTSTPYVGDLSIFETPGRDERLQIGRVMDLLRITPGKSVADIGAGSGWFTVRAARRAGAGGTVFAEDINPQSIEEIGARAKKESLPNIRPVLGTPSDLKLQPDSLDAALLLKMYHEIADPVPVMKQLRAALKSDGRVGVIDRNGNGSDHGVKRSVVEREMAEAGFRLAEQYDFTKADGEDYFLIFVADGRGNRR